MKGLRVQQLQKEQTKKTGKHIYYRIRTKTKDFVTSSSTYFDDT